MREPRVAVVIPTFNRVTELRQCLSSLYKSSYSSIEVIVVDNGSTDQTKAMVKHDFSGAQLINLEKNFGASEATNIGVKKALDIGADFILRLDSDAFVHPEMISWLVLAAQSHPNAAILSPKIYYAEPDNLIWYGGAENQKWFLLGVKDHRGEVDNPQNSRECLVDCVWGAAMFIRCSVLLETPALDTDYFVYFEDLDFCRRIKNLGHEIWYIPDAIAWHKVGTAKGNAWQAYQWNRSKVIYIKKHSQSWFQLGILLIFSFVYPLFRLVFPRKRSNTYIPVRSTYRGLFDGLIYKIKKV